LRRWQFERNNLIDHIILSVSNVERSLANSASVGLATSWVKTRRKRAAASDFRLGFIEVYQPAPANAGASARPTAHPEIVPMEFNSTLMVVGAAGFEPATSYSRIKGTPLSP
jgi:hypothetical protein